MQGLGWLTIGAAPLWNTAHLLPESSTVGDILHTFLGYAEAPTVLQGIVYVTYLAIAGSVFAWLTRKPVMTKPVTPPTATAQEHLRSRA
jgi:high-affinity iron transporter